MNDETNLFNPTMIDMSRSTFAYHPTVSGTCLAGRLIPIKCIEVLPGDSIKMDLRTLVKMSTPVYPTMDMLYMDVAFYFVPNKLVLGRRYGSPSTNDSNQSWAAFIGAQDNLLNMPVPASGITLPRLACGNDPAVGTLPDYFGYPLDKKISLKINALDALSYFAIWNENYRDPNTMEPVTWGFSTDAGTGLTFVNPYNTPTLTLAGAEGSVKSTSYGSVGVDALGVYDSDAGEYADYWDIGGWLPFPVSRFHGYFGSALPWPQRNQVGVELPLGSSAPVVTGADHTTSGTGLTALKWITSGGTTSSSGNLMVANGTTNLVSGSGTSTGTMLPRNLWADLSEATAANVNALRAAIQKQRWYEHLARSGNRLDELEFGLFGIRPHDSGDDRPLYLGGKRIPLTIEMVASTNGGTSSSSGQGAGSLGALGAFSHTNDSDHYFYHSFDTWGTLMCVMCIRHHDTFDNTLDRRLTRATRDDFYWPTFAHLGEQAILKRELYFSGTANYDDAPFGYQEAWSEYRHDPDKVTGLLRSGKSLNFMTYANAFGANPFLQAFLNASGQAIDVDRTLAVSSQTSGFQFVYQFTFDYTARRCMPTYSDPGLIDHF